MTPRTRTTAAPSTATLQKQLRTARRIIVVLTAVAVFLGIIVVAQSNSEPSAGAPASPEATPGTTAPATPATGAAQRIAGDPQALGAVDAPVVLVEWADFRCPFCAVFTNQTLPTLIQEYVDKGLVRYEFNDSVLFGDQSIAGAVAARAAGEQGKFHEYMAAVYAAAPERDHPDLPREKLLAFAEQAGVPDMATFESDLDRPDLRVSVEISNSRAKRFGATTVPYFMVGEQVIAGAQPIETFRRILDEQLELAGH